MFRPCLIAALLFGCYGVGLAQSADDGAGLDFFEQKVRPLLVERCYECHSREAKKIQGGLRLDSRAGILQGGDSGPAVVAGKPTESRLIDGGGYQGEAH